MMKRDLTVSETFEIMKKHDLRVTDYLNLLGYWPNWVKLILLTVEKCRRRT